MNGWKENIYRYFSYCIVVEKIICINHILITYWSILWKWQWGKEILYLQGKHWRKDYMKYLSLEAAFSQCFFKMKEGQASTQESWFLPAALPLGDPIWSTASSSGVLNSRKTWATWNVSRRDHEDDQRAEAPLLWKEGQESRHCSVTQ